MQMHLTVGDPDAIHSGSDEVIHETKGPSRSEFLRRLFRSLDDYGIRYCVLHSFELLPDQLASDLDLAIHPHDLNKLSLVIRALERGGYTPVQCLKYAVGANYFVFAWFEGLLLNTVAVDVISEHRRAGLILASGQELVAGCGKMADFWVPAPATEFSYLLAKKTLKKRISSRQEQRLKQLADELGINRAEEIAEHLFGRKRARQVVQACMSASAGIFLQRLGKQLWRTTVIRNPLKLFRYWPAEALRVVCRWFKPTGLLIAMMGPDGVGKSTLIHELARQMRGAFRRCRCFHYRPGILWRGRALGPVTDPHRQPPNGVLGPVARLFLYVLDYWIGYCFVIRPLMVRSCLVIFDRYFDDLLADPERYRYRGPVWLVRILRQLIPRPDLVLILNAPEEVIFSRKQEVTLEELRLQLRRYGEFENEPSAEMIDTTLSCAHTVAEASCVVTRYLWLRFQQRNGYPPVDQVPQILQEALDCLVGHGLPDEAHVIKNDSSVAYSCTRSMSAVRLTQNEGEPPGLRPRIFAVLPSVHRPRWLLPLGNSRATRQAIEVYTPYAFKARFLKALLVGGVRMNVEVWARDRLLLQSHIPLALEEFVRDVTGEKQPVFSMSLGTPSQYRKLTVQVMNRCGHIIGYVKLPLTVEATARIQHEAAVLSLLQKLDNLRPHLPEVLYAGHWQDGHILFVAPVRGQPGPTTLTELHRSFLHTLHVAFPRIKGGTTLTEEVAARFRFASARLSAAWRDVGERVFERTNRDLDGEMILCGLVHGDFAPWNTRLDNARLSVFDWECASWEAPCIWDYHHFHVQVASLLRRPLGRHCNRFLYDYGDDRVQSALLLLYLLNSIVLLGETVEERRAIDYRGTLVLGLLGGTQ